MSHGDNKNSNHSTRANDNNFASIVFWVRLFHQSRHETIKAFHIRQRGPLTGANGRRWRQWLWCVCISSVIQSEERRDTHRCEYSIKGEPFPCGSAFSWGRDDRVEVQTARQAERARQVDCKTGRERER